MNRDDSGPGSGSGNDPKKDYLEQGKQFANDLRDTVSKKVADNEGTLRGTLGKAARWVDEKTGGKYSEQIGKAQTAVGDGIGRVAGQAGGQAEPHAPGAAAGDGTDTPRPAGSTRPMPTEPMPGGPVPGGPVPGGPMPAGPDGPGGAPSAPGAQAGPPPDASPYGPPGQGTGPRRPPQDPPTTPR